MATNKGKDEERLVLAKALHLNWPIATEETIETLSITCQLGQPLPWDTLQATAEAVLISKKAVTSSVADCQWDLCLRTDLLPCALIGGWKKMDTASVHAGIISAFLDLAANRAHGTTDHLDAAIKRILTCYHLSRHPVALKHLPDGLAAALLERLCLKHGALDDIVDGLVSEAKVSHVTLEKELGQVTRSSLPLILRCLCRKSSTSEHLKSVLGHGAATTCVKELTDILLSSFGRFNSCAPGLVCYLASSSIPDEDFFMILERTLWLWGDPVIAKAYVAREVMHYTSVALLLFIHLKKETLILKKNKIVEHLTRGLPNHFNSPDGRTVALAHYLSEIFTETLKKDIIGNNIEKSEDRRRELASPTEELCQELSKCLQGCCEQTQQFWLKPLAFTDQQNSSAVVRNSQQYSDPKTPTKEIDSDDDDDDLEPIETMAPPEEAKVIYVRDFLETLREEKEHASVKAAFQILPAVAQRQLAMDHPKVGEELLEVVFNWENVFEDPTLDQLRKSSMTAALVARPEPLGAYLCQMFDDNCIQPYRKNLLLDVLSNARDKLPLSGRLVIAQASFSLLMRNESSIRDQDIIVWVPMILYFAQTLCCLPPESVTSPMVAKYLGALAELGPGVDAAIEQTVQYALTKVMDALGESPRLGQDEDVRASAGRVRDWMTQVRALR